MVWINVWQIGHIPHFIVWWKLAFTLKIGRVTGVLRWMQVSHTADSAMLIRPTDFSPHRGQLLKELFCTKPNIAIPRGCCGACIIGVGHNSHCVYLARFRTKDTAVISQHIALFFYPLPNMLRA